MRGRVVRSWAWRTQSPDDVRERAERLPRDDGRRLFAEIVLGEAGGRLSQPCRTLHRVQNRGRLLRALDERLDRVQE
ncbi:hypothetical protein [Streptomyces sp. NPDC003006]